MTHSNHNRHRPPLRDHNTGRIYSCDYCASGHTQDKRFKRVDAVARISVAGEFKYVCAYHEHNLPQVAHEPPPARNPYGTTPEPETEPTDASTHGPEYMRKKRWFDDWRNCNPSVVNKFFELSDELRAAGKSKTGAWLIIGRMRWDHEIETRGSDFKLPNEAIAFLAREYMASSPQRHGFFDIKTMNQENFAATQRRCGIGRLAA